MSSPADTETLPPVGTLTLDESSSAPPTDTLSQSYIDTPNSSSGLTEESKDATIDTTKKDRQQAPYKRREWRPMPVPDFDPPPWQIALEMVPRTPIPDPQCVGHTELPNAHDDRVRVSRILAQLPFPSSVLPSAEHKNPGSDCLILSEGDLEFAQTPLFKHLSQGLALTTGSALGSEPPSVEECLKAYLVPNRVGMSAGARAWAKHAHRSMPVPVNEPTPEPGEIDSIPQRAAEQLEAEGSNDTTNTNTPKPKEKKKKKKEPEPTGWWGNPKGPLAVVNARALEVFFRIVEGATWRNLHWLPHEVLVYEVRVEEGYGMRWAREMGGEVGDRGKERGKGKEERGESERDEEMVGSGGGDVDSKSWMFRGFVEPMMENGHEVGWRHPLNLEKPAVVEAQVSEGLES